MKLSDLTIPVGEVARLGLPVIYWRYECLLDAGYPVEEAISLAERSDIDLHVAVGLLARGASVKQAMAILN